MSSDRLRQAAQKIRETAATTKFSTSEVWAVGARATLPVGAYVIDHIALWSPPVALAVAEWLDDVAADAAEGIGSVHPRALDVTDLILGSVTASA
jgi:hypothetical protein